MDQIQNRLYSIYAEVKPPIKEVNDEYLLILNSII